MGKILESSPQPKIAILSFRKFKNQRVTKIKRQKQTKNRGAGAPTKQKKSRAKQEKKTRAAQV